HLQPAYEDLGHKRGDFPVTEAYADRILSLPMYAELTSGQIEHVSSAVAEFLAAHCARQTEARPVASRASRIA
ncbi:MAG: DegT/DnrJ/EryC1/StrS family aminotransferase, partial [Acidobacteria bacterium Pan2503]|nr:DegT/DnrJ/EryC1/StrS family aminotransferase [Candidatus Acidoferrum panamensis]